MTNWYQLLEVAESASPDVLKAAWRLLQRRYHPDNKATGDLEKSKLVNIAYDVLSDPDRRAAFDQELARERNSRRPAGQYGQHGGDNPWPGGFPGFINPEAYPGAYPGTMEIDLGDVARDLLLDASIEIGGAFLNNALHQMSPFADKMFLDAIAKKRAAQRPPHKSEVG
jgi:DnaJ-class molecular chaperone